MRPTKQQMDLHDQAMSLIESDKPLTHHNKLFIFENYIPFADGNRVDLAGTFFTPWALAITFSYNSYNFVEDRINRVVDICAGIGVLTYAQVVGNFGYPNENSWKWYEIDAVEINPRYVEIGKRILPEVNWICADVFDKSTWDLENKYDHAISNPPFGITVDNETKSWLKYQNNSELMIAEIASRVADSNTLILPQNSVPAYWQRSNYGGRSHKEMEDLFTRENPSQVDKFMEETGLFFDGTNFTTEEFRDLWKGAKPQVEIAHVTKEDLR